MRRLLVAMACIAWCVSPRVACAAAVTYRFDGTLLGTPIGVYSAASGPVSGTLIFDYDGDDMQGGTLPKDSPLSWSTVYSTTPVFTGTVNAGAVTVNGPNSPGRIDSSFAEGLYRPAGDGCDPWSGQCYHYDEHYDFLSLLTVAPTENSRVALRITLGGPSSPWDENGIPLPFSGSDDTSYHYGSVQLYPAGAPGDFGTFSFRIDSLRPVPVPSGILLFTPAALSLLYLAIRRSAN